MIIVETGAYPQEGVGRPDFSSAAIQEPWVAGYSQRPQISAGWIHTIFDMAIPLPAKQFTPFATLTAEEVKNLGIEAILMEWWIASSPNVYCRCYVGDTMICSPLGCCPALCYASMLTDPSLPISTHVYDEEAGRYGIICRFRKDIGRGYKIEHGLFNDEETEQTCEIAAIAYQRKVVVV
ncbi:hypothetical protein ES703_108709 [subsurface metagenome]|jgi:hypothetical protein